MNKKQALSKIIAISGIEILVFLGWKTIQCILNASGYYDIKGKK